MLLIIVAIVFSLLVPNPVRSENKHENQETTVTPSNNSYPTKLPIIPNNDVDFWDTDDFVPYKNERHDEFDWQLLKKIFDKEQTNTIISPFSVKLILTILLEAAGEGSNTQKELYTIFPNLKPLMKVKEFYKNRLHSLKKPSDDYVLNIATKMFVDSFITPKQRYLATLQDNYDTEIENLNFSDSINSANKINNWCSNATNGYLMNLVHPEQITSSVLLMINAIYFDGLWRKPFNNQTFENPFFLLPTKQVKVTYMTQKNRFHYFESKELNAKLLRLPYKGKKFSMTIVLPSTKGGLDETLSMLDGNKLRRIHWLMDVTEVEVVLPKLKFDYTTHMKDALQSLGINDMFTNSASLPGLARGPSVQNRLKVSNIIQKAGLIIDEKGTTAFAATEVEITNKFGGNTMEEFRVNRPFAFFIDDEINGTLLFAGKVLDPTK